MRKELVVIILFLMVFVPVGGVEADEKHEVIIITNTGHYRYDFIIVENSKLSGSIKVTEGFDVSLVIIEQEFFDEWYLYEPFENYIWKQNVLGLSWNIGLEKGEYSIILDNRDSIFDSVVVELHISIEKQNDLFLSGIVIGLFIIGCSITYHIVVYKKQKKND